MKNKMLIIGIVTGFILGIVVTTLFFAVYRNQVGVTYLNVDDFSGMDAYEGDFTVEGRELTTMAATEKEAKEIAELYGIELVEYRDGVAEYTTDREIREVITEGVEKGYPQLSINYKRKIMN